MHACRWEEIDHPDAVATPAEVYASLTKQGFAVTYLRLPVTDGAAPLVRCLGRCCCCC